MTRPAHCWQVIFNAGVLSEYPAQELSDFLEESKRLIQRSYQVSHSNFWEILWRSEPLSISMAVIMRAHFIFR
jgi:hypothetical protein